MTDHWHTIGMVLLIALCALLVHTLAVRAEEPHDHSKMGAAGPQQQRLLRNERRRNMNIKIATAPANTKDNGRVRLGGESPSFGPAK